MAKNPRLGSVLIDANVLVAICSSSNSAEDQARIDLLLKMAGKDKSVILLPTPALAEFLTGAPLAAAMAFSMFERKSYLRLASFDKKAAVECADLDRRERSLLVGSKRGSSTPNAPYQKVKFDRQIVAIGMANNVDLIIARDGDILNIAKAAGIQAVRIQDLPKPEAAAQISFDLSPADDNALVGSERLPSVEGPPPNSRGPADLVVSVQHPAPDFPPSS